MNRKAIETATRLFRDVRMLSAEGCTLPEERFSQALAALGETDADAWLRYCCETLRELSGRDLHAAYAFADAVHNTCYLEGLEDGRLLWPQSYWELEIEPFRTEYGQMYFSSFTGCVYPDHEIKPDGAVYPEEQKEEKCHGAAFTLFQAVCRRLCARRGHKSQRP